MIFNDTLITSSENTTSLPKADRPADSVVLFIGTFSILISFEGTLRMITTTDYFRMIRNLYEQAQPSEKRFDFSVLIRREPSAASRMVRGQQRHGISYLEYSENHYHLKSESCYTSIDLGNNSMTIEIFNELVKTPLDAIVLFYIKLAISLLTIRSGGLPFHSSALMGHDGSAFLFSGQSGAGKSTIASILSERMVLLNDEFNLILPDADHKTYIVHSTPFTSPPKLAKCRKSSAQINTIYHLYKNKYHYEEKMSISAQYNFILSGVYMYSTDAYTGNMILENALNFVRKLRIRMLYFSNDISQSSQLFDLLATNKQSASV